ncbi:unnamed protein product, partial [Ceratitis capitata]
AFLDCLTHIAQSNSKLLKLRDANPKPDIKLSKALKRLRTRKDAKSTKSRIRRQVPTAISLCYNRAREI